MDIGSLTPRPGRLKCVWVRGADGRPETVWVPDWELEAEVLGPSADAAVSG